MIIAATRYGKVGGSRGLPKYTCSGIAPVTREDSETGNWEMHFLGNCTIQFDQDIDVDIFAVSGGKSGGTGDGYCVSESNAWAKGGDGGAGGGTATTTTTLHAGTPYSVTIGEAGTSTIISEQGTATATAVITATVDGGVAGGAGSDTRDGDAENGSDGVYAFNDANTLYDAGVKYGASGAGGASTAAPGIMKDAGTGGATGGGDGGKDDNGPQAGAPGQANTGCGGGGGASIAVNVGYGYTKPGGLGGSGRAIIRNARTSS